METGSVAALVVLLTLACVLAVSGAAKVRDLRATRDAFDALRVPSFVPADLSARVLPWAELVIAACLLVLPAPLLVPAAAAALLLMLAYAGLIARALSFDEPVTCSCFGSIGSHDVDRLTLSRNVLLVALSAAALWFALDGGSAPAAFAELDASGWWTLLAAAAAAAVAVLVAGGRAASASPVYDDLELDDYDRQPIPYGVVSTADGTTSTLVELASTQAVLILILNPGCGPCIRLGAQLDDWSSRLAPALSVRAIYPDAANATAVGEHSADLAVWEPERNVRRLFGVTAPAAVLLGADGLLAGGPVMGEDEVEALVEDVLEQLGQQPADRDALDIAASGQGSAD